MVSTTIDWDGRQNVVVLSDGKQTMRIPLDDFLQLKATRYVIELALERADLLPQQPELHLN